MKTLFASIAATSLFLGGTALSAHAEHHMEKKDKKEEYRYVYTVHLAPGRTNTAWYTGKVGTPGVPGRTIFH